MSQHTLKVMFVVTGNKGRLSYVFANQLESLVPNLSETKVFQVHGKGITGYIRNLLPLRREIKEFQPDVVHAHYSLCGYLAAFTGFRPIVVSLMGSDCRSKISVMIIRLFHRFAWAYTIVKSREMLEKLAVKNKVRLIPNGVDLSKFEPITQMDACAELDWDPKLKHIVFVADPKRPEKNFVLAREAVKNLCRDDVLLHTVHNIPHDLINLYLRAADLLLLTSLHEGSPNVIKEAMACDLPIVSTDVGDVKVNIGGLPGCHVVSVSASEVAEAIKKALNHEGSTGGRSRLLDFKLDAETICHDILGVYKSVSGLSHRSES